MKVLKHGWYFYQINNEHIVQCRDCECEFKYDDNDTYTKKSIFPIIDENGKPQYAIGKYVKCPECGHIRIRYEETVWNKLNNMSETHYEYNIDKNKVLQRNYRLPIGF